ncbi:MAG: hypothetical protein EBY20_02305 [Alphaproteobacteria bacterium]|nr:hypothetical protein [Alphaproteobacteria bacterium]
MARSRKTTFRKKMQRKVQQKLQKSRKQQGGGIHYDQYLQQAKNDIFAAQENYYTTTDNVYGSSFFARTPIKIPGKGMYIGKYYVWNYKPIMSGTGMLTSFETDEKTGLPRFIKEGDWKNDKEDGYFIILYGNGDVVSSVHMKNGLVLPSWTEKGRKGEGDLASQYTYSNGQIYQGDLILKSGKIVPANDLTPPRIVRRGLGLRGRLSGIRGSRATAVEDEPEPMESRMTSVTPMDRANELRQMRELAASQTALKPLPTLERGSVLPAISSRKGGKYRKQSKKTKKTRKNKRKN